MAYKNKTISIALATYNGEIYIKEQLLSIIKQSVKPDQIVIADGGSIDDTVNICCQVLKGQTDIEYKILRSDDQLGVNSNFERAIESCNGDFIFFSDQDDVWLPQKLEEIVNLMLRNNAIMAFANAQIVDRNLNKVGDRTLWDSIDYKPTSDILLYHPSDRNLLKLLIKHNVVTGMSMCLSTQVKQKIIPFSENGMYDRWIALVALHTGPILSINRQYVLYRQHGKNQVGTTTNIKKIIYHQKDYSRRVSGQIDMMHELLDRVGQDIPMENRELINSYCRFLKIRQNYLNGKNTIVSLLKSVNLYKEYEYFSIYIMFKDIVCKIVDNLYRKCTK